MKLFVRAGLGLIVFAGFIVPLPEGNSRGAKRQAGGRASRNVSSRAQAGLNMARARPPARALLALSPFSRGTFPRPMFCCFGQVCSQRGTIKTVPPKRHH